MPRATTKAPSLADGPTLASTRDYWILHLRSEGRAERTISTYLRALDRLDGFLAERDRPHRPGPLQRVVTYRSCEPSPPARVEPK